MTETTWLILEIDGSNTSFMGLDDLVGTSVLYETFYGLLTLINPSVNELRATIARQVLDSLL